MGKLGNKLKQLNRRFGALVDSTLIEEVFAQVDGDLNKAILTITEFLEGPVVVVVEATEVNHKAIPELKLNL